MRTSFKNRHAALDTAAPARNEIAGQIQPARNSSLERPPTSAKRERNKGREARGEGCRLPTANRNTLRARPLMLMMLLMWNALAHAGAQKEEQLANSVRILLRQAISANMPQQRPFSSNAEYNAFVLWQMRANARLTRFVPNAEQRQQLFALVDYEARRAGLEPALVMAVIEVESQFKPTAKSYASARGLMQVMPFWTKAIGDGQVKHLNNPRINVRYGCVILRHYLDMENGDMVRALGRYNGSLGQMVYPNKVLSKVNFWR